MPRSKNVGKTAKNEKTNVTSGEEKYEAASMAYMEIAHRSTTKILTDDCKFLALCLMANETKVKIDFDKVAADTGLTKGAAR